MKPCICIKRVYEAPSANDGFRILVDRLWPRGLSKDAIAIDHWDKDVAPSNNLRQWFNHDPLLWQGFTEKYFEELSINPAITLLISVVKKHKKTTLVYAAKDEKHNQAVVLQQYLTAKCK